MWSLFSLLLTSNHFCYYPLLEIWSAWLKKNSKWHLVNSLQKKKIQNRYVRKHRNGSAIYLVYCKLFDCAVGYMMPEVLTEFINLFVEKHFYLNNVNFWNLINKAVWLSWLKCLYSKQEIVSSNLIPVFFLALAAKKRLILDLNSLSSEY